MPIADETTTGWFDNQGNWVPNLTTPADTPPPEPPPPTTTTDTTRPDLTQGPPPEPNPGTIGASPNPDGGPADQPAPINDGTDTGARVGIDYGPGYEPSPNAPAPAPYVPPKLDIKDYTVSDSTTYENQVYKYDMITKDYNSRVSDFESKWADKIQDGNFTGTDAEYERYLKEYKDLEQRGERVGKVKDTVEGASKREKAAFEKKQAEQQDAIDKLGAYKDGDGYDIGKAIRDGKTDLLRKAGFTDEQISEASKAGAVLTGKDAFDRLVADGKIPAGSRFDRVDESGNVVYFPPYAGVEDVKAEFEKLDAKTQMRYVSQTLNPVVLSSDSLTPQKNPFAARSYDQLSQADKERVLAQYRLDKSLDQMNKDTAIGLIPIVGTIYTWQRTSTPWRAVNIATDVLTVVPVGKIGRFLKGTAGEVEAMIREGRAVERATIKATSPKEVVKAYDAYVKAADEFAKNKSFIKESERAIARGIRPEAIDMGPELRTLQQAKEIDGELAIRLKQSGDAFAKAQQIAKAKNAIVGKAALEDATLADFGNRSVANARNTIDAAYAGKIGTPAKIEKQITSTQKALKFAEHDQDIPRIRELTQQMAELNAKLKVSKSGELRVLHDNYVALAERMKTPGLKASELKQLRLERLQTEKKLVEAMKEQEAIWQQPWSKGRGNQGRQLKPRDFGPGGGGKKTNEWNYAVRTRDEATDEAIRERDLLRRLDDYNEYQRLKPDSTPFIFPKESLAFRMAVAVPAHPKIEPVVIPKPDRQPAPEPDRKHEPARVPHPAPRTSPRPAPSPKSVPSPAEKGKAVAAPSTAPAPGTSPSPAPSPGPQPHPKPGPSPSPAPQPQPQPGPQPKPGPAPMPTPTPTPTPTPGKGKERTTVLRRPDIKLGGKDWSKKEIESAAAYSAGMGVWGIRPPGGAEDWKFWMKDKAPPELKITDRNTAYDTIRLWKGTKGFTASRDMGIVDVTIAPTRQRGAPGAISFKADRSNWSRRPKPSRARLSKDIYSHRGTLSHVARRSATRMSRGGVLR